MLITRYAHNPILTKADVPYPVSTVHNAAVVKFKGQYMMVFRAHKQNGRSILAWPRVPMDLSLALIPNHLWYRNGGPFKDYEEYGVEDPRIVCIDGDYVITYSAYSRYGVRIALAKTGILKRLNGLFNYRSRLSECGYFP